MPNNLTLKITDTAIEDMSAIFSYVSKDNKHAAKDLVSLFYKTFDNLLLFPNCGFKDKSYLKREVRILVVAKHYQIVYYIKDNQLFIQRVLTGYEDYFQN